MATTSLTLLNNILRGLRKDEIATGTASLSLDYHKTLLDFINTALADAEESHNWDAQRTSVTVTGAASTSEYTLTIAGDADVDVLTGSRLLYDNSHGWRKPQVWDVTDSTAGFWLREISAEEMEAKHRGDADDAVASPGCFAVYSDNTSIKLRLWPTPSGINTWLMRFWTPQVPFTAADLTETIEVPPRPIWLRALFYAQQERGDDAGTMGSSLDERADDALRAAIAAEADDDDLTSYAE